MGPLEEALEYFVDAELIDLKCYAYALEEHFKYERYGFPYRGGHQEQSSLYLYILDCVTTAKERADREKRAVEATIRNMQQANAGQPEAQNSDVQI